MPRRLRRCPVVVIDGSRVPRADSGASRLLGLALLSRRRAPAGLLLPRTRSVHTVGMRFPLNLVWLDDNHAVVRVDRAVPPFRLRSCRTARSVLERPSR